jgi:hypothetical protein
MLTRFDDYPIHQTPEPIAQPVSNDRNAYDRYWFNGFHRDGSLYFGVALGLYPNRRIMDCAFSVVRNGVQYSFHASRRAPMERDELQVGPFRIEILEPMRRVRVTLSTNDSALECSLTFTARTAAIEEERQTLRRDHRVFMDVTRFTQFGQWEGEILCADERIDIRPEHTLATRDRSWGIRPVGEPDAGGAPLTVAPQIFFLWAPLQWDDGCTHLCVFEDANGRAMHAEGKRVGYSSAGADTGAADAVMRMNSVGHRIRYLEGTRRLLSAELQMDAPDGQRQLITVEPLALFQMKGLGYRHPQWAHGVWKGELATGHDTWRLADLNPLGIDNVHIQQLVRARMGDREGIGIIEQLCVGPHRTSGFTGILDGAR